jgi:hypothetical protein
MKRLVTIALVAVAVCGAALIGLPLIHDGEAPTRRTVEAIAPPPSTAVVAPPRKVGAPTRVVIPALDLDEPLHAVGLLANGDMETPRFTEVGWYDRGPRPGAPGPAVVVAHVHGPAGDDVFAHVHRLRPGDRVTVRRTDGASTFVVETVEQAPKGKLPYRRVWSDDRQPVLRLITCAGRPDPVTRVYPDNTIVYLRLAR